MLHRHGNQDKVIPIDGALQARGRDAKEGRETNSVEAPGPLHSPTTRPLPPP
jgi:hypothetical protein